MNDCTKRHRPRLVAAGALMFATSLFGLVPSCEGVTKYFDPCGTILGNCAPGTFELLFADVPDWDVDPTCTIPGGCVEGDDGVWVSPFAQLGP